MTYYRTSVGQLKPAGVDRLSLFEDSSTELGGGAALLELLQTLLRLFSKQETLQRIEEPVLHQLLFLLRAGLFLQAEDLRDLLLQVGEHLRPAVCSLQPFLQEGRRDDGLFFSNSHLHQVTHNHVYCPLLSLGYAYECLSSAMHQVD